MEWLMLILVAVATVLCVKALRAPEPRPDQLDKFDFDEAKQQES